MFQRTFSRLTLKPLWSYFAKWKWWEGGRKLEYTFQPMHVLHLHYRLIWAQRTVNGKETPLGKDAELAQGFREMARTLAKRERGKHSTETVVLASQDAALYRKTNTDTNLQHVILAMFLISCLFIDSWFIINDCSSVLSDLRPRMSGSSWFCLILLDKLSFAWWSYNQFQKGCTYFKQG